MITVNCKQKVKKIHNFWNNFHFHPTDAIEDDWGKRILDEAAKDNVAGTVRMYAMLEDIVSMDISGKLSYDFALNDKRLDYMVSKGYGILLSYNFIPPCIAEDVSLQSNVSKNKTRYKGKMICTSRIKDYDAWEEICYRYTEHITERYGRETVSGWYLQCYNEPDIAQFFMGDVSRDDEGAMIRLVDYLKLYRGFARAVEKVEPSYKIGQSVAHWLCFFDGFLKAVCDEGLKFDFACIHNYGTYPSALQTGLVKFTEQNNIRKHLEYENIVRKYFPKGIEIVADEWGACTNGFQNCEDAPVLKFREDSRFSAYYGRMITEYVKKDLSISKMMICLSGQHEMETDFTGFRNFITLNFIKKPIYNAYSLASRLYNTVLGSSSDCGDVSVLATGDGNENYSVMLTYASEFFEDIGHRDDTLSLEGLDGRYHVTVHLIDETHTNPCTRAEREGYPKKLTEEQIKILRDEGTLKPVAEFDAEALGRLSFDLSFDKNALCLVEAVKIG